MQRERGGPRLLDSYVRRFAPCSRQHDAVSAARVDERVGQSRPSNLDGIVVGKVVESFKSTAHVESEIGDAVGESVELGVGWCLSVFRRRNGGGSSGGDPIVESVVSRSLGGGLPTRYKVEVATDVKSEAPPFPG